MAVVRKQQGDTVTIAVQGRFDYLLHREFLNAYHAEPKGERQFVIDLAATESLDSAALGMLLQLRGHARANSVVELRNGSESIREVLQSASFDKLFALA